MCDTQILIDHVCAFVARNQVEWLDLHSRPMKFNRSKILMEAMITIECFRFKEKYAANQEGREMMEVVDNAYYLLSICLICLCGKNEHRILANIHRDFTP